MQRFLIFMALSTLLLLVSPLQSAETVNSPLPELTLTVPEDQAARDYLGLNKPAGESFTIEEIDADILVIELFSMYCPFCQEEAPLVNELYQAMKDYSVGDYSLKIIGLGANNTQFEVDHFQETYSVAFPLFPDKDMSMYEALEGKGTPGFVCAKRGDDGKFTIIMRQSGGFNQAEEFLSQLLQKGELK